MSQNPQFCQPASVSLQCKSGVSPGPLLLALQLWNIPCRAPSAARPSPQPCPYPPFRGQGSLTGPLCLSREFTAPPTALEREEMGPVGLFTGS